MLTKCKQSTKYKKELGKTHVILLVIIKITTKTTLNDVSTKRNPSKQEQSHSVRDCWHVTSLCSEVFSLQRLSPLPLISFNPPGRALGKLPVSPHRIFLYDIMFYQHPIYAIGSLFKSNLTSYKTICQKTEIQSCKGPPKVS